MGYQSFTQLTRIVLFHILFISISSCQKEVSLPVYYNQGNIGPEGGIVQTADGASVEIPAGALKTNQTISITNITGTDTIIYNGCRVYKLEPDGLIFSDSVIIKLPFDDSYLDINNSVKNYGVNIILFQDTAWVKLKTEVDLENRIAKIKTLHFSDYVIRYPSFWTTYYFLNKAGPEKIYNVPFYCQGKSNWCAYYALSMVLKYAGYQYKAPFLATLFNEPEYHQKGGLSNGELFVLDKKLEDLGISVNLTKIPFLNASELCGIYYGSLTIKTRFGLVLLPLGMHS